MSLKLKAYEQYSATGQEWLGSVPSHWEVVPHRAVFREIIHKGHPEAPLLSVTIGSGIIQQGDLLRNSSKKDSSNEDKGNYKLVQVGDIAYNKMRAWQGALGFSQFKGIVSPAYIVVRPYSRQNPRFYHYLMRTPAFMTEAERWSYGITSDQWSLRSEDFKCIHTVVPPLLEQDAIVHFIRYIDHQVNRLIKSKRRLIELLNEQKQATVSQVLGSALDASGAGDKWQLGHLAKVGNGSTPYRGTSDYWSNSEEGFPWLNSASVNKGRICDTDQFVSNIALRECHLPRVPIGSVLVAITGQGKTRGTAAILEFEATINQHLAYITLVNNRVSPEYLHLVLTASYQELRDSSEASGSTKAALTCADIRKFRIRVPVRDSQDEIADRVKDESHKIEIAISKAQSEIDLIREYRTRLVADVVTGQLDVRGIDLPQYNEGESLADAGEPDPGVSDEDCDSEREEGE